jgi:site-specific recombinase XerD
MLVAELIESFIYALRTQKRYSEHTIRNYRIDLAQFFGFLRDNGIKIFDHSGYKLPDEEEHDIEEEIFSLLDSGLSPHSVPLVADPGLDQQYLRHLLETASSPRGDRD